jgi:hypothetical protein
MNSLQALQDRIAEWQGETFPNQTLKGKLEHLVSEAMELRDSPNDETEWADVLILLLGAAAMKGMTVRELELAANVKFCLARQRQWGPANAQGFHHHVE